MPRLIWLVDLIVVGGILLAAVHVLLWFKNKWDKKEVKDEKKGGTNDG
jgi:hypothetical protein